MNIHMCKGLRLLLNTLFTHSPSSFYFIAEQCILITPAPLPFPQFLPCPSQTHLFYIHTNIYLTQTTANGLNSTLLSWYCLVINDLFSDNKNAFGGMVLGPERQLNRVKLFAMQAWQAYFKPQSAGKGCCYELKDKNSHPCYRPNIQVTFQCFHTGY